MCIRDSGNIVSGLIKKTIYSLSLLFSVTQFCFFYNYIHNRLTYNNVTPAFSVPSLKPAGAWLFRILVRIVDQIFCTFTLKQGKLSNFKHNSQRMIATTSLTRQAWTTGLHNISRHNTHCKLKIMWFVVFAEGVIALTAKINVLLVASLLCS